METNYSKDKDSSKVRSTDLGRVGAGIILVVVGGLLVAREMGVYFPYWFFSWPMLLIGVGLFIGVRHSFKSWGWLVPTLIGCFFLLPDVAHEFRHYFWPIVIIGVGLVMILRPRGGRDGRGFRKWDAFAETPVSQLESADDTIDSVAIFGSMRKNVISKRFKGGDAVCIFGGTELNFTQADLEGVARLELVQIFGGAKLIVPANWKIQSDVVTIFGGIDDKRSISMPPDSNKILKLDGTCLFGGIEIKSF